MSKSQSGFTLIEMMIAVVVISILVAIGFPSFRAIMRSNRISSQSNSFIASVNLARAEAIKNNYNAVICASADGVTCTTTWKSGWLVFDDTNNDGLLDGTETVMRYVKGNPDVAFDTNPAGGASTIVFNQRGMYTGAAAVNLKMYPNDCPTGYQGVRNLTLLQVGQLTVLKASCP